MTHALIYRRLHWLNLPATLLLVLLQRTPVMRMATAVEQAVASSPIAAILRSAFTAVASLGAVHALAGATEMLSTRPSPLNATVGTAIQTVSFFTSGTTSNPDSWTIGGSIPPGLTFSGRTTPGTVNVGEGTGLQLAGTPTQAGDFTVSLRAHELSSGGGAQSPQFTYQIIVTGAAAVAPSITSEPTNQIVSAGQSATFTVTASGTDLTYQWQRNGANVGTNSNTLTIGNAQAADIGVYQVTVTNSSGNTTSGRVLLGIELPTGVRAGGGATLFASNITHPNGNIFDQVLLTGPSGSITATYSTDPAVNRITRMSYIDINHDIVQVEFGGRGTLSIALDGSSGPAAPVNYNQATVSYMRGHATIVISGADETTNVSVFTVGRLTAFDPSGQFKFLEPISSTNNPANNGSSLFSGHSATVYDGFGNIALLAIVSSNGKFGGVRTSNTSYFATNGITGVYAPNVEVTGPLFIQNISASENATPVILVGAASNSRITGGDLSQPNGRAVQVSGFSQLLFTAGIDSHGNLQSAKQLAGNLEENGTNVNSKAVFSP